ncbi:MAG: PIN domain-containing protein [Candidatus Woesearchaeota archaeon]
MKIVIDSNILFTYFWKDSYLRKILKEKLVVFFIPNYSLYELEKYLPTLRIKAKLSEKEIRTIVEFLKEITFFIPRGSYNDSMKLIKKRITTDPDDIDFIALAYKLKLPLWSNDRELKNQKLIPVLNTKQIIELADEFANDK